MKRKLTPQEKKQLSLQRDHVVVGGENDKAFRRKWPKKKSQTTREFRHKVNQTVGQATAESAEVQELKARDFTRKKVEKWGVTPIGKAIKDGKQNRRDMHGARIKRRLKNTQQSN